MMKKNRSIHFFIHSFIHHFQLTIQVEFIFHDQHHHHFSIIITTIKHSLSNIFLSLSLYLWSILAHRNFFFLSFLAREKMQKGIIIIIIIQILTSQNKKKNWTELLILDNYLSLSLSLLGWFFFLFANLLNFQFQSTRTQNTDRIKQNQQKKKKKQQNFSFFLFFWATTEKRIPNKNKKKNSFKFIWGFIIFRFCRHQQLYTYIVIFGCFCCWSSLLKIEKTKKRIKNSFQNVDVGHHCFFCQNQKNDFSCKNEHFLWIFFKDRIHSKSNERKFFC